MTQQKREDPIYHRYSGLRTKYQNSVPHQEPKSKFSLWLDEQKKDAWNKVIVFFYFFLAGIAIWGLMQLLYLFYGFSVVEEFQKVPYIAPFVNHIIEEIALQSPRGLIYMFAISSLFFLPVPMEILFFGNLATQPIAAFVFIAAVIGITIGQIINFWLGRLFGFLLLKFIKKKTQQKIEHWLERMGSFAILLVHVVPFPFQLFNVIAGAVKFPFTKWLVWASTGILIKHIIMVLLSIYYFV